MLERLKDQKIGQKSMTIICTVFPSGRNNTSDVNRFFLILYMHWRQTSIFNKQASGHCCEKLDETIDYRKINGG